MNPDQKSESFGSWVKSRRKRLDLTQAELGKNAGCSAAAIRKIEADERKPSRELAESLAKVLQIAGPDKEIFLQSARGIVPDKFPSEETGPDGGIPNNLPVLLTSTVDRVHDLAEVTSLLRNKSVHLVTLIGPPGIGKTRLSIHCGKESLPDFPDGVWFVDLAEIDNESLFASTVVRSLDFLEQPPNPGINQLISGLKNRNLLLILDNFEQIVNQAATLVAELLKTCPDAKLLITSRIPLHIYGEHEYPLPSLSVPPRGSEKEPGSLMGYEAVQLLATRIRQHQPKFAVTAHTAKPVVEICQVLEGIPLALELAAASLRRMTLEEMVSLLQGFHDESWVKELSTPARDLPHRQRTLENVVAWSYSLLTPPQQDLFCKLGLFSGWFDDEAVAAICFGDAKPSVKETHRFLEELADHSLLVRDNQYSQPCWRMLELIHEYSNLMLDEDVRARLRIRFTEHFLDRLSAVNQINEHRKQDAFYHLNVSNLHAALRWAIAEKDTELGFLLAWHLDDLWMSHGYSKEGLELLKQLFALPDPSPPDVRIARLTNAADIAWQKYDFETSLAFSRETGELSLANGLQGPHIWFLNRQGRIFIEQGCYDDARRALEECYKLALDHPGEINPGSPLAQLGEVALFEGKIEEAKQHLKNAVRLLTDAQAITSIFIAIAYTDMAEVSLVEKDFDQARHWLSLSNEFSGINLRRVMAFLCACAGLLILPPGRNKKELTVAARCYGVVDSLSEQTGIILGTFYQNNRKARTTLARKHLSAREWEEALQAGQQMNRDEAMNLAKALLIKPS
jgi:predicted ATPase/transcriptional regulator with XRE-family HTH domain